MAILGNNSIYGSAYPNLSGGYVIGQKFTLSENGTITDIRLYCTTGFADQKVRFAIYTDEATMNLKCETAELTEPTSPDWLIGSISSVNITSGNYWICFLCNNDITMYYTGSGGYPCYRAQTYGAFPSTFARPTDNLGYANISIFATYTAAGGDAGVYAGEVGLGLVPNSPVADLWSDTLLKWCDEGESSIGDVYLRAQAQPDFYLGLYTNSTEPAEDATMAGISEPSGDYGYARVQLADGDWSETSQATFTNLQKTFTCATSGWGDVYGWFITTAATGIGGKLITVEHFSDGPYSINVSDIVKVTPKLTFT